LNGPNRIALAGAAILMASILMLAAILDGPGLTQLDSTGRGLGTRALAIDVEGRRLITANWNTRTIGLHDLSALSEPRFVELDRPPWGLAVQADPPRLHILCYRDPAVTTLSLGPGDLDRRSTRLKGGSTYPVALAAASVGIVAVHWSKETTRALSNKTWYEIYLPNNVQSQHWTIGTFTDDLLRHRWKNPAHEIFLEDDFHEEYEGFWRICLDRASARAFVTCSISDRLWGFDLSTGETLFSTATGPRPMAVAFDEATGTLAVANSLSEDLTLYSAEKGERVGSVGVGVGAVALASDREGLFVLNRYGNRVDVVDAARSRIVKSISVGNVPSDMVIDPGSERLYVAHQGEDRIWVINRSTLEVETVAELYE